MNYDLNQIHTLMFSIEFGNILWLKAYLWVLLIYIAMNQYFRTIMDKISLCILWYNSICDFFCKSIYTEILYKENK